MLHIGQMIDNANQAVTAIHIAHAKAVGAVMMRTDFTLAQKQAICVLMEPITAAISHAQSKFAYDVKQEEGGK